MDCLCLETSRIRTVRESFREFRDRFCRSIVVACCCCCCTRRLRTDIERLSDRDLARANTPRHSHQPVCGVLHEVGGVLLINFTAPILKAILLYTHAPDLILVPRLPGTRYQAYATPHPPITHNARPFWYAYICTSGIA